MTSRLDRHDKQRKINKLYNISITIVSLLIVIVAVIIFTDDGAKQVSKEPEQTTPKEEAKKPAPESEQKNEGVDEKEPEEATTEEVAEEDSEDGQTDDVKLEKVDSSGDANVLNTYVSNGWQPVATEQTGPHTTSFQKGSTDWNEMTKAIAYGAGLDEGSMRLWWLKNGGSPTTAIGTVTEGDNPQAYRVYIEWVDGAGWKPVKVEELKENDKGR